MPRWFLWSIGFKNCTIFGISIKDLNTILLLLVQKNTKNGNLRRIITMLIEPLLGYKSTWRILSLLLETPRKPVSRVELLRYTRLGNAPLSRGLDRLVHAGIVVLEKRGKKEFYYVNERNEYLLSLREIWNLERKSLRNLPYDINLILSEFLRGINENCLDISKIVLFGSHAKGTASVNSDIDIAVVFSDDLKQEIKVTQIVRKLEKQFKIKIQVHYFTGNGFGGKNKLVEEIKRDGIELLS